MENYPFFAVVPKKRVSKREREREIERERECVREKERVTGKLRDEKQYYFGEKKASDSLCPHLLYTKAGL